MNEANGPAGQVQSALKQVAAQRESNGAERQRELLKSLAEQEGGAQ